MVRVADTGVVSCARASTASLHTQAHSVGTSAAPPEVEATLSRLVGYKNVKGVLVLSRPNGIILRSAGPLFAHTPARADPEESGQRQGTDAGQREEERTRSEEEEAPPRPPPAHSELARRYARSSVRMVDSVRAEVKGVNVEEEEDVRFLRIRTRRHELMITPDEQYILVVVQDPTS